MLSMGKGSNKTNCKDDNVYCSVACVVARAKGDKRPCYVIRIERCVKEVLLIILITFSLFYYIYLKGK